MEGAHTSIPGAMRVVAVDDDAPGILRIPLGTLKLRAGVNGVAIEPDRRDGGTLGISLNWVRRKGYDPDQLIAMPVAGDSMAPTIYEGDTVIINKADKRLVDGAVYAINFDGEPIVKRMARDAGQWWMMSDNPDQRRYFRRACHGQDCIIIGRVVRREGDHL
jgi:phage repressor protein C with HTH and peptisase S24 domain